MPPRLGLEVQSELGVVIMIGAIAGLGGGGILTLVMIVVGDVVTLKERGMSSLHNDT